MTNLKTSSKQLESENWEWRGIFSEPRLSELVTLYRELGFEVRIEPIYPAELPAEGCRDCFLAQYERFRTIYTRPIKTACDAHHRLHSKAVKSTMLEGEIMAVKHKVIEESQQQLESLIGLGIYQAESEILKDYLRDLQARYEGCMSLKQLRQRLDRALGSRDLSAVLREMREEEMY